MSPRTDWRRVRAAATAPTSTALLHGVGALLFGSALVLESPAGLAPLVFRGPEQLFAWTTEPWLVWGTLFATAGATVLALGGGPASRWCLAMLAGCWGAFGVPALVVGLTADAASCAGGLAFTLVCLGSVRGALELDRDERARRRRCPLGADCMAIPLQRAQ